MDYKDTLNLPKTDFQMQAKLPKSEPKWLEHWNERGIYEKLLEQNADSPTFVLHDGPPYANGHIHIGHALNKILKDVIVRYKAMTGHKAEYVPGWDCHGLPIEHKVMQALKKKGQRLSKLEVRKLCREYAEKHISVQRDEFIRLGIFGDWQKPYLTMNYEYEAAIVDEFRRLVANDYVYRGVKPVYWCSSCVTALAEAEVEYADHTSDSIYVKFPLVSELDDCGIELPAGADRSMMIWTTTPWTLPGNVAVAVHPRFEYAIVLDQQKNELLVLLAELVTTVMEKSGITDYKVLGTVPGKKLEHKIARHPFLDRDSLVVLADYVTTDTGTGCVHTAPGHGHEDYITGLNYDLPIIVPVDEYGRFHEDVEFFGGLKVAAANMPIINKLTELGLLLATEKIEHSYPHCWRCKRPVIFRATEQWFVRMETGPELRKKALAEISNVNWIPHWGRERINGMVENRPDWCLSRQRSWGVAIPVFYCNECGKALLDDHTMAYVRDLTKKHGSDIWFDFEAEMLIPPGTKCECGHDSFWKGEDILDVWFDSGASFSAVTEPLFKTDADLYLEGSDQHRGWFQSSLLLSVANRGKAPYKSVLTHGFTVDGKGKKMSKSLGNTIAPQEIIDRYGADILRLWVVAADYREDVRISKEILARLTDAYRKIRNSCRFILGNLYDYNPATEEKPEYSSLDLWLLSKLQNLVDKTGTGYEEYEFHIFFHALYNFCSVTLSTQYLDIIKARYTDHKDSAARRAVQATLYKVINTLARLMAPVLVYTADEVWSHLVKCDPSLPESVHLASFPTTDKSLVDPDVESRWDILMELKGEVNLALETARREKVIGHSLDATVGFMAPEGELITLIKENQDALPELFIVSAVDCVTKDFENSYGFIYNSETLDGLKVGVRKAAGNKCERCWKYSTSVGELEDHPTICGRCRNIVIGE